MTVPIALLVVERSAAHHMPVGALDCFPLAALLIPLHIGIRGGRYELLASASGTGWLVTVEAPLDAPLIGVRVLWSASVPVGAVFVVIHDTAAFVDDGISRRPIYITRLLVRFAHLQVVRLW